MPFQGNLVFSVRSMPPADQDGGQRSQRSIREAGGAGRRGLWGEQPRRQHQPLTTSMDPCYLVMCIAREFNISPLSTSFPVVKNLRTLGIAYKHFKCSTDPGEPLYRCHPQHDPLRGGALGRVGLASVKMTRRKEKDKNLPLMFRLEIFSNLKVLGLVCLGLSKLKPK